MPPDDHSHLSNFNLGTTVADLETPSFGVDAAFPPTCHDLSTMEPDSIHHPLQINPLNPDLDCSSINGSDRMNDGTLDPMPSLFDAPLFGLDLTALMDVGPYQMQSDSAVPQSPPFYESLFEGSWYQGSETENTCSHFDGHSSYPIHPLLRKDRIALPLDFTVLDLPTSTYSEAGSSLGSEYSDDPGSLIMCHWDDCCSHYLKAEKSEVAKHLQVVHDVKPGGDKLPMKCTWDGCGKSMKKESISRHIVAVHLSKKTECGSCGKQFARWDSKLRHIKNSKRECNDSESESCDNRVKRPCYMMTFSLDTDSHTV